MINLPFQIGQVLEAKRTDRNPYPNGHYFVTGLISRGDGVYEYLICHEDSTTDDEDFLPASEWSNYSPIQAFNHG